MNRRTFLSHAIATTGLAAAVRRQSYAASSPNETVNVAVAGIRRDNEARPLWTSRGRGQDLYASQARRDRHMENFVECVRSRKWQALNAEIHEGHMSTSLCHLGNISYRLGRSLVFDSAKEQFAGDAQADALLRRSYRAPYLIADTV
jgi:hypothetical protein